MASARRSERSEEGTVFLVAPVGMQGAPEYERALEIVSARHPGERVVPDRGLFESAADWHARWRGVFESAARLYILTAADGTVGRGVFEEWKHVAAERGAPAVLLCPTQDETEPFEEYERFTLKVLDSDNWTRHAVPRVEADAGGPGEGK